jgi:hypothetical protein
VHRRDPLRISSKQEDNPDPHTGIFSVGSTRPDFSQGSDCCAHPVHLAQRKKFIYDLIPEKFRQAVFRSLRVGRLL